MINRNYAMLAAGVIALLMTTSPIGAQQAPVRVPRSVLEQYVGEYVYPEGTTLKVTLNGDTLFREDPGRRVVMVPVSETVFALGGGRIRLTAEFVTDNKRGFTMILGNGANMEFRLPRKGSRPILPPAPEAVPVPKAVLERYVGVYEYIAGQMNRTDLRVFIRLEGNTLTQQMDTAEKRALIPISETRFAVSGTSLVTEFVIDDAGVTCVMGSYGREMLARLTRKD